MEDAAFSTASAGVRTINVGHVALVSVERPTVAEAQALERDFGLDRADLDMVSNRAALSGVWRRESYVLMCVPLPVPIGRSGHATVTPIGLVVGRDFLLVVHFGEVRPLLRFLRQLDADDGLRAEISADHDRKEIDVLLPRCFEHLVDVAASARGRIERQTTEWEQTLIRGGHGGASGVSQLVAMRGEARLVNRLVAPLPEIGREAAGLGLPTAAWDRVIARATRLAELSADDLSSCDALLLACAADANSRVVRSLRALVAVILPALLVAVLVSLPYGNPLASLRFGSAVALAVVGVVFLSSLYLIRRDR